MASPGSAAIELRLLGAVEAARGEARSRSAAPDSAPCWRCCCCSRTAVSAERLVEELWHGSSPARCGVDAALVLSRLRARSETMPSYRRRRGLRRPGRAERVDVVRFERLPARVDWRSLGAPPRAPPNVSRPRSSSGEGPSPASRRRRAAPRGRSPRRAPGACARGQDRGRPRARRASTAGRGARDAGREHPFRERLWRHLMLALYRADVRRTRSPRIAAPGRCSTRRSESSPGRS